MMRQRTASEKQRELTLETGDETLAGSSVEDAPVADDRLMEKVLDRENLFRALHRVKRNKGSAGIDGMTIDDLPTFLHHHWPKVKAELINGTDQPHAVKRVEIPKPGGGVRKLGIPTVLDRLIQQAMLQVLQSEWDRSFSHFSFGFRPNRSAHHAVACSQQYINEGYRWVVDMDLEKFFDQVNHDQLMSRVKRRISDPRVLKLIDRYLKSGAIVANEWQPSAEGTPQGGPLSPLLANLLLDDLDKELEQRGHKFVRYADDCNIYVKSERAGLRVLDNISRYLSRHLKLTVNAQKSAVARPWNRRFLGFTFTRSGKAKRLKVSEKAIQRFKQKVRELSSRTRGKTLYQIIADLRKYLLGWKAYFGFAEVKSPIKDLEKWLRRRLRSYLWKQWGRSGYRQLRRRGVSVRLAWNTSKSAHGPWRLSQSPALVIALPRKYFVGLGLPVLVESQ
jgi:RNA-directed DNA polymerase